MWFRSAARADTSRFVGEKFATRLSLRTILGSVDAQASHAVDTIEELEHAETTCMRTGDADGGISLGLSRGFPVALKVMAVFLDTSTNELRADTMHSPSSEIVPQKR